MAPPVKLRGKATIGNPDETRAAEATKIVRLRALRLAKEAGDREAERIALVAAPAKPKRSARAHSSALPDR